MGNKKFGYDIKIDYSQATENTNRVTSSILQLQQAVERLKRNSDIQIKFTGLPRQLDSITTKTATLANALERTAQSGNLASKSFDGMSAKMQSLKKDGEALAKGLQDSARAIKSLETANHNTMRDGNKAMTVGTQINQLKNQADVLYQAWKANNVGKEQYLQQMTTIQGKLNTLYGQQRRINSLTEEHIPLLKQWGFELDKVGSRLGYFATRWAALWVGDKIMDSLSALPKVEQDMAGFAQVMKHGTGATNAFAHSLIEVDPKNMVNGLQLSGEEARHFKHELEDMQGKLQGLAVKYGTTSHEMIESAKLWGRAYKDNNTVLALTDAATKLAVADAFDIVSANKALESSIMQWGFQINNANDAMSVSSRIIDSWTSLAHNYTVSAQTLSEANKRMAQSAAEVGVSFHSAQALVSVMARKTQADGGEIGNALKSIFGSIHSKKAIKALQEFGIEVYKVGENGEKSFRKVDDVLLDLMIKAQGSKESMEDLLKAISGGKWQWNKADAMLDLHEYLEALRLSSSAMGFTNAQVGMQLDTIQTKIKQIAAQWEKFMTGSGNVSWVIKGILDGVLQLLTWLDKLPKSAFLLGAAMTALVVIHRNFGNVFNMLKTNVVAGWNQMALSAQKYARAARIASASSNSLAMKTASIRGAFTGVGRAIGSATAFMGGWVGIIAIAVDAAYSLYEAYRFSTEEIEKTVQQNSQLLQQHQELYARMGESEQIVGQFINAYTSLNEKLKEYQKSGQDVTEIENQMHIAKEGIIEILGKENTEWILNADNVDEATDRAKTAINDKKTQLEKAIEAEKIALLESARSVRQQAKDNLESLKEEKKGWFDRVMVMMHFADAIEVAKEAYYGLMQLLNERRASDALKNSVAMGTALHDMRVAKNEAIQRGASEAEIADFDYKIQHAEEGMQRIEKELYDANYNAKYYKGEQSKVIAGIAAKIVADEQHQLADINSAAYGNNNHGSGDTVGGGTTGGYPRSELDDDGGGSGSNKGSKGAKGKTIKPADVTPILDAANEQLGKPYELGADGTWATDCGKLFSDAVRESFNADMPRYVPDIMKKAREAGAWHDEGDGYVARAGDAVVVLGDNHVIIADGKGGYTGANSSTGVVAKPSITGDFGAITGTVDMSKMLGYASAAESERQNSLAKKAETRRKKAEELTEKLNAKMEEMEAAMIPKEQQEFAKKTADLHKKMTELNRQLITLVQLDPKADVKKYKEVMEKYNSMMEHRLQDEQRDKNYDEAVQMMKDRHETEDLDREIAGTSENFWTSDIRNANRLVEEYIIKFKKYQDMVAAFKRGDSEYTEADIRKAGIELKKLEVQIKKTGNSLNKDIKQQTHDVFHSIIFEGKKLKDVWKDLWKQLAEDALKMIFKINDGKGGLLQNALKLFDKKYKKGINPNLPKDGKDGSDGKNIGGFDASLDHQMLTAQSTRNLDKNFETFLANTQNGTAWQQATFTDAVIYGNVQGEKGNVDLPENTKDKDGKTDVSQYINAGMKISGLQNNKWMGALGTVAGFAKQFGLLKFASGGSVDKDQLVRVGEGDKKEWIIPTGDKKRGIQLLNQAARDLGVGETKGIEPNWKNPNTHQGALSEQTKRQDRLMNQMVANTSAMTKGMNYMANNGSTHESIAQPVFVKQTISDQDFLAKYNKLVALGKMK